MYGKRKETSHISISLVYGDRYTGSAARNYCDNINSLSLCNDEWIHAIVAEEDAKIKLGSQVSFEIIKKLEDWAIQKILREVDTEVLKTALQDADKEIQEKVFKNMTHRAVQMLKEDMEIAGPISRTEVIEARKKIIEIIMRLDDCGEIIVNCGCSKTSVFGTTSIMKTRKLLPA
jgi:sugar-specific transcriptional regulator TrmB